jgi:radical SAM superfamily enzyme YgiQ (UPF0313 family)
MKIGYYTFGGDISQSYGLALCLYLNNISAEPCTKSTARFYDVLLVSVFWWKHVEEFFTFCKDAKVGRVHGKTKTRLIVGGYNSFSPRMFERHAHVVVVGDGDDVILDAINGVDRDCLWYEGKTTCTYNNAPISDHRFIYQNERDISRVEIARGCLYRCKFCQLSAIKKYREVKTENIIEVLRWCKTKAISVFAPNRTSHSGYDAINSELNRLGIAETSPDVRFNHIDKARHNQTIQIGVEGLSERLRYQNGKKLSDDEMVNICRKIIDRGVHKKPHLFIGIILGLPEQVQEDFNAFSELLDKIGSIVGASCFTLFPIFNMFMPMPHTAYESEPIKDLYFDYQSQLKAIMYDRKFKMCVRGRLHNAYSRIKSMVLTRLGQESEDVLSSLNANCSKIGGNLRTDVALNVLKSLGVEDVVGVPKSQPWKCVCLG